MHADISLPWSGSRSDKHHRPSSFPRSFDHLVASCSHPKYICPTARWLCQHPVYHPFFTAIAASRLASGCSRFYHSSVSSTALPLPSRRVAKCRVGLVAKLALDSICQNLSMHVTRTTLLIRGLAEKLAISNDTIREHLRPVRVVQYTSVMLLQLKAVVHLRLCCLASRANTDKHTFAPVTGGLLSYSASSTRAPCAPVARQRDAVVRSAVCRRRRTAHPRSHV